MTPTYCQPINFIKVYKFAIFLAEDHNRSAYVAARGKGGILFREREYPLWNPKRKAEIGSLRFAQVFCLWNVNACARRSRV